MRPSVGSSRNCAFCALKLASCSIVWRSRNAVFVASRARVYVEAKAAQVKRHIDGLVAGSNQPLLSFDFLDLFNCIRAVLGHTCLFRDKACGYPAFSRLDGAALGSDVRSTGINGLLQGFVGRLQRQHNLLEIVRAARA
jgi:hypothetical protein